MSVVERAARPARAAHSALRGPAWQITCKRALDIVVAGVALTILSPLFPIIALAIKITSPGPILYGWPVVGRAGRPLRAFKFRTMVVGAEALKPGLLDRNEATGPVFKMRSDPRITPVGRILRRFSLDELPQLWSVLRGDLSLVGPRPVLVSEWVHFNEWQRGKLDATPGMICLWHVYGQPRNFDEWVRLDLKYIHDWSLWLDLKVLVLGAVYLVRGRNC